MPPPLLELELAEEEADELPPPTDVPAVEVTVAAMDIVTPAVIATTTTNTKTMKTTS